MRPTRLLLLSMLLLVVGCTAEPQKAPPRPAPAPIPVRPVSPPPAPQPVPAPPSAEWQDMPLSDGTWSFSEQSLQASFGSSDPSFVVRCDPRTRQVQLLRPGVATGNTMVVRTSEMRRVLPLSISQDAAAAPYASLGAEDSLLDGIAFSRGRFSIELPGMPMLVIPSWPEPARVIEECRR